MTPSNGLAPPVSALKGGASGKLLWNASRVPAKVADERIRPPVAVQIAEGGRGTIADVDAGERIGGADELGEGAVAIVVEGPDGAVIGANDRIEHPVAVEVDEARARTDRRRPRR